MRELVAEAEAVDTLMDERNRAYHEQIAQRRTQVSAFEDEALQTLADRIASFDTHLAEQRAGHLDHLDTLSERNEAAGEQIDALTRQIAEAARQGGEAEHTLAAI